MTSARVMANRSADPISFRRASSPPMIACYEQRDNPYKDDEDDYSDDGSEDNVSCSEDGDDYGHNDHVESDSENEDHVVDTPGAEKQTVDHDDDIDMEIDDEG
jgi:hypothetical protein